MPRRSNNRLLNPRAVRAMEQFKYQIASEVGIGERAGLPGVPINDQTYEQILDTYKYRVADEIGLRGDIERKGWPQMATRDCGAIGGRVGGAIGGRMVARMIELAERNLAAGRPMPSEAEMNQG